MIVYKFFHRIWNQLLIAFDTNYTPEGFERTQKTFNVPEDLRQLDPKLKRIVTICNLFANQKHSMWSIAQVLDISPGLVVSSLIEQGLIKDRRKERLKKLRNERRQQSPRCITKKPGQHSYITSPAISESESIVTLTSSREVDRPLPAEVLGEGGENSETESSEKSSTH
jgi:hypothetical protein